MNKSSGGMNFIFVAFATVIFIFGMSESFNLTCKCNEVSHI